MQYISAPIAAKSLLRGAALRLGAANPLEVRPLSNALEESLTLPVGDPAYSRRPPLRPSFAEERASHLDFAMDPLGPTAAADDRTYAASRTMEDIVGTYFGSDAQRWLRSRSEPATGRRGRSFRWGAEVGTSFDRDGVRETMVTYEWGPDLMDAFPEALYRLARIGMDTLPGLRPAYTSIRCGRTSGSQQVTFAVDAPLALSALRPMMDALGLGEQHAGLMSAVAFVLGARFTLPPNSCSLTLRPLRGGVELRLDVNLELLPDLPPQLMSLLRLQMAERPSSLRALDSWLVAMTPEGYERPGTLNLLSVCVRPEMPARISLHLRPSVLESPPEPATSPEVQTPAPPPAAPPPSTVVADSTGVRGTTAGVFAYPR
jgi:hypothetical protein